MRIADQTNITVDRDEKEEPCSEHEAKDCYFLSHLKYMNASAINITITARTYGR